MIGLTFFNVLIGAALLVTSISPIVLLVLLINDLRKGELW